MECIVRVLEFIEGQICQKLPVQEIFFREIGACCGKTHKLMQEKSSEFPAKVDNLI